MKYSHRAADDNRLCAARSSTRSVNFRLPVCGEIYWFLPGAHVRKQAHGKERPYVGRKVATLVDNVLHLATNL